MTVFRFRLLVGLYCVVLAGNVAAGLAFPFGLSQELARAYEAEPLPLALQSGTVLWTIGTVALIGAFGAPLAFLAMWRLARVFAFAVTGIGLLVMPFMGPVVDSAWTVTLVELGTTLWGMILAFSWSPALKDRFR